ncbi:hypothetical protein DL89DRAFT_124701 [Linderina pennispora]|uniref:Uncharacterized protein n=1 Tax=Linderina pennispora TaxID=61395 RepID=A0A1Y1WCY9_9FUNG|nr:uncharacterized protein DL89DRAFT_124701 [Linderina pennispora]ORX71391.1 hypothetical protein DL89DRAFT_124701 [Linderina pennispora]
MRQRSTIVCQRSTIVCQHAGVEHRRDRWHRVAVRTGCGKHLSTVIVRRPADGVAAGQAAASADRAATAQGASRRAGDVSHLAVGVEVPHVRCLKMVLLGMHELVGAQVLECLLGESGAGEPGNGTVAVEPLDAHNVVVALVCNKKPLQIRGLERAREVVQLDGDLGAVLVADVLLVEGWVRRTGLRLVDRGRGRRGVGPRMVVLFVEVSEIAGLEHIVLGFGQLAGAQIVQHTAGYMGRDLKIGMV